MSDQTFTYKSRHGDYLPPRTSVMPRAAAEALADMFEARESNPFSTDWNYKPAPGEDFRPAWPNFPEVVKAVAGMPDGWRLDVSHILAERATGRHWSGIQTAICELPETMRVALWPRAVKRERGLKVPSPADLSHLCQSAKVDRKFKPAYKPTPGCSARLMLKQAICVSHRQEAYADESEFFVPVELPADADVEICKRNLAAFAAAARTHTGFAGSGSNYSADLITNSAGSFVVIYQRASIAD